MLRGTEGTVVVGSATGARSRVRCGVAIGIALALSTAAAACGSSASSGSGGPSPSSRPAGGPGPATVTTSGPAPSTHSSPFVVGHEPAGYLLAAAGQGNQEPLWGSDSFGTDEPFVVLAPASEAASSPRAVIVAVTGFEGYQGGLGQASAGYNSAHLESFSLDGTPALYSPEVTDGRQRHHADLVVDRGSDLAVRVNAVGASRDQLVAIARHVHPQGRDRAPAVDAGVPGGLRVVGSLDAGPVAAALAGVPLNTSEIAGTAAAHTVGFVGRASTSDTFAVLTFPGRAGDPAALPGLGRSSWGPSVGIVEPRVAGRTAVVLEKRQAPAGQATARLLAMRAADGDLLMVVARSASAAPSLDEIVRVAASVTPTDDATWRQLVLRARGGPGLHADPGALEIQRGSVDGDWLLQALPPDKLSLRPGVPPVGPGSAVPAFEIDPCLKRANGQRVCAHDLAAGGPTSTVNQHNNGRSQAGGDGFVRFIVVSTTLPAATVSYTSPAGRTTAPLVPVAGTSLRAAILFPNGLEGLPPCQPGSDAGLQLLDAAGRQITCLP
ncbi:MAG: hypothetical protein JWN46_2613 [Acidimicrobiales bacterium]|nr:hypothetical protein [Acidimicrobiales bacterium]